MAISRTLGQWVLTLRKNPYSYSSPYIVQVYCCSKILLLSFCCVHVCPNNKKHCSSPRTLKRASYNVAHLIGGRSRTQPHACHDVSRNVHNTLRASIMCRVCRTARTRATLFQRYPYRAAEPTAHPRGDAPGRQRDSHEALRRATCSVVGGGTQRRYSCSWRWRWRWHWRRRRRRRRRWRWR